MRPVAILLCFTLLLTLNSVMPASAQNQVYFERINDCEFREGVCVWEMAPDRVGNIILQFIPHPISQEMIESLRNPDRKEEIYLEALNFLERTAQQSDRAQGLEITRAEAWPLPVEGNLSFAQACLKFIYNYVGYGREDMKLNVFSSGLRCAIDAEDGNYLEFYLMYGEVFPFSGTVSSDFTANVERLIRSVTVLPE